MATLQQSPLFQSAFLGDEKLVREFLSQEVGRGQLNELSQYLSREGQVEEATPLYAAACRGHTKIVSLLANAYNCDLNIPSSCGTTPILAGCLLGFADVVEELLRAGASVEHRSGDGGGLLHAAAQRGYRDITELLLLAGCSRETKDSYGATALNTAAHHGHLAVVESLIVAGCGLDTPSSHGWTPLNNAARAGHTEVVEALLSAGCDKDFGDHEGWTPLHCACLEGRADLVSLLLAVGATRSAALSGSGEIPRDLAVKNGHLAIVELFDAQPSPPEPLRTKALTRLAMADARLKECWVRQAHLQSSAPLSIGAGASTARGLHDSNVRPHSQQLKISRSESSRLDQLWTISRAWSLVALACSSGIAVRALFSAGSPSVALSYNLSGKPCLTIQSRWALLCYPLFHLGLIYSERLVEKQRRNSALEMQATAVGTSVTTSLFLLGAFWRSIRSSTAAVPEPSRGLPRASIGAFLGAVGFGALIVGVCAWVKQEPWALSGRPL